MGGLGRDEEEEQTVTYVGNIISQFKYLKKLKIGHLKNVEN